MFHFFFFFFFFLSKVLGKKRAFLKQKVVDTGGNPEINGPPNNKAWHFQPYKADRSERSYDFFTSRLLQTHESSNVVDCLVHMFYF